MLGYKITFFRHGKTQANADGRYIGVTDLPLSSEGVEELYDKISKYDYPPLQKIYCSPLKRCRQTAEILQPETYSADLQQLIEMNFGKFENKTAAELANDDDYKKFMEGGLDNPAPDGESVRDVVNRCYEALVIIVGDMMREGYTNVGVCTHAGIIMNMMACFGVPKRNPGEYTCDFGEGFVVTVSAAMWQRSNAFEVLGRYPFKEEDGEEAEYSVEDYDTDKK